MNAFPDSLTRSIQRPFSSAHWSLLVALVVAWCFLLFGAPCRTSPRYWEVALFTLTVCIALWTSHVRPRSTSGWRKVGGIVLRAGCDLLLLVVLVVACCLPLAMLTPTYDCMTPKRRASVLILSASSARVQIAERVAQSHTLRGAGAGVSVAIGEGAKAATVTEDGVIVVAGDDPVAVAIFQPSLVDGKISWSCKGFPSSLMPSSCR